MTQIVSTREHKRKKTLVYDPLQQMKDSSGEIIVKRKRVAAYARVSTEQDAQQNSYEAQIGYYTDYIQRNSEWEFVKVYSDEGISGTSYRNRDGFNEMVADAKDGKIDLILTKSISRFARNTVDSLVVTRELKRSGVEVFFEKENISSMDAQAELIFTIMSSIAQEESRSISENVRWGVQRSMEAGRVSLPWKSFLGFERGDDGLPRINEEEAKIVRKIYRDYLNGATLRQIARKLDTAGVKKPLRAEGRWSPETIRHILTNEKYKGDAVLQKTYTVDFLSKEVRVNRGERRQWYIRDSHDAIITAEAFRQAAANLRQRAAFAGRYFSSPFSSKLYCGKCGYNIGFRHWDLAKENVLDAWMCGACYRKDPVADNIMLKDAQIRKTFMIALGRLAEAYEWSFDDYEREILGGFNYDDSVLNAARDVDPTMLRFTERAWHQLLDSAKVMPDRTIIYKFRNGKKVTVALSELSRRKKS